MKIYDVLKVSNSKYISLLVRGFDSREFKFPKYIPRYPIVLKCIGGVFFKGLLEEKVLFWLVSQVVYLFKLVITLLSSTIKLLGPSNH